MRQSVKSGSGPNCLRVIARSNTEKKDTALLHRGKYHVGNRRIEGDKTAVKIIMRALARPAIPRILNATDAPVIRTEAKMGRKADRIEVSGKGRAIESLNIQPSIYKAYHHILIITLNEQILSTGLIQQEQNRWILLLGDTNGKLEPKNLNTVTSMKKRLYNHDRMPMERKMGTPWACWF